MTGSQNAVLWMGILLITVRLLVTEQWHDIWGVLSATPGSSGSGVTGSGSSVILNPAAPVKKVENLATHGVNVPATGKNVGNAAANTIIPGSGWVLKHFGW